MTQDAKSPEFKPQHSQKKEKGKEGKGRLLS
jgi:hypothetical protein